MDVEAKKLEEYYYNDALQSLNELQNVNTVALKKFADEIFIRDH